MEGDGAVVGVEQRIPGDGLALARLTDRAGVHHCRTLQRERFGRRRADPPQAASQAERHRDVGMAENQRVGLRIVLTEQLELKGRSDAIPYVLARTRQRAVRGHDAIGQLEQRR